MTPLLAAWLLWGVSAGGTTAAAAVAEVDYIVEQTNSLEEFRGPSCGRDIAVHAGVCRYGRRVAVRRGGSLQENSARKEAVAADLRDLRKDPIRFARRHGHAVSARGRARDELLLAGKSVPELEAALEAALSDLEVQRADLARDGKTLVRVLLAEVEGRYFSVLSFSVPEGFPFPLSNLPNWDFGVSGRFQRSGTLALGTDGGIILLDVDGLVRPLAEAARSGEAGRRGIWAVGESSPVRLSRR